MLRFTLSCVIAIGLMACLTAQAATTAFTYQGQLKDNGAPVSGSFDFTFVLFDAATVGTQVGTTVTKSAITVTGGLFTVELDFGAPAFGGADRFLEIAARTAGGASFTTFSARQKLTPAPYALFAQSSGAVPSTGLPIAGTSAATRGAVYADGTSITVAADGKLAAAGSGPPSGAAGGDLGGTYPNPTVAQLGAISGANLTSLNGSNIASGTVPTARLDTGTGANQLVKLDGTGKLPAVDGSQLTNLSAVISSGESLRIVRGRFDTTDPPTILQGTGFTVVRNGTGDVTVSFSSPFSSIPVVTSAGEAGTSLARAVHVLSVSVGSVRLQRSNTSGAGVAEDGILHFIAIGPP